jgi:hypothetical protein
VKPQAQDVVGTMHNELDPYQLRSPETPNVDWLRLQEDDKDLLQEVPLVDEFWTATADNDRQTRRNPDKDLCSSNKPLLPKFAMKAQEQDVVGKMHNPYQIRSPETPNVDWLRLQEDDEDLLQEMPLVDEYRTTKADDDRRTRRNPDEDLFSSSKPLFPKFAMKAQEKDGVGKMHELDHYQIRSPETPNVDWLRLHENNKRKMHNELDHYQLRSPETSNVDWLRRQEDDEDWFQDLPFIDEYWTMTAEYEGQDNNAIKHLFSSSNPLFPRSEVKVQAQDVVGKMMNNELAPFQHRSLEAPSVDFLRLQEDDKNLLLDVPLVGEYWITTADDDGQENNSITYLFSSSNPLFPKVEEKVVEHDVVGKVNNDSDHPQLGLPMTPQVDLLRSQLDVDDHWITAADVAGPMRETQIWYRKHRSSINTAWRQSTGME